MASAARSSAFVEPEEDHGERFVSPFLRHENLSQEVQLHPFSKSPEPVLKRAASVFFADLVASSTSSQGHLSYTESQESFLRSIPSWDFKPQEMMPPAGVLDPLLPPDEALRGLVYPKSYYPVSQYQTGWKTFETPAFSAAAEAPSFHLHHHLLDEDLYQYDLLNDTPPPFTFERGSAKPPEEVETRPNDEVLELLYSRIPTQEEGELEQELGELGDLLDGLGSDDKLEFVESLGHGECGEDCRSLVSSIANLSEVLLAHYTSKASGYGGNKKNMRIQDTIHNLTKCLMHAHRQANPIEEEEEPAEVEENTKPTEEQHTFSELYNDEKKPEEKPDEESNEELMARFRVLLGLSSKNPDEASPEKSCVEDNFKESEQAPASYLNDDQVEQRLALLKARPNWSNDEGEVGATIQVKDDYISGDSAAAAGDVVAARQAEKETIVYTVGVDKFPSDSEESSWEHI